MKIKRVHLFWVTLHTKDSLILYFYIQLVNYIQKLTFMACDMIIKQMLIL